MEKYIRTTPTIVSAKQITEDSYDGFVRVCAHSLDSLLFVDERLIEEKFKDSNYRCDYEDDGHCMKKCGCECVRKLGYISLANGWYYPLVGDYLVIDEHNKVSFMTAEKFESMYKKADL